MLTIGLGGIAGLAAIFTDSDKIPEDLWPRGMLSLFAICAVLVVIFSAMGISSYANHLRDVEKISREPGSEKLIADRAGSEKSIIIHAQGALLASGVSAIALIVFAGLKLFQSHAIGPEAAMKFARTLVGEQSGNTSPLLLEHFQISGNEYLVTYSIDGGKIKYSVSISRDSYHPIEITRLISP